MSNLIGGGRMARAEIRTMKGDNRSFGQQKLNKTALLKRLWQYLGRNRRLLVLAVILSLSSSLLALYGPKLSGTAINAIDLGAGKVDFSIVYRCVILMAIFYTASSGLTFLLNAVMIRLDRKSVV